MATLFSKPLVKNNKVGTSDQVHEPETETHYHTEDDNKMPKIPLWNPLRFSTQNSNSNAITNRTVGPTTISTALGAPTRPIRSTRSSGPSDGLEAVTDDQEGGKFSVDVGLGTRWTKWALPPYRLLLANR